MSIFKRPSTHYGKSPEPETPYQRAGQVWDDRIGSARVQARNWRIMAFGSLTLSAGLSAALVWQTASGSIVPWVVQIDHLGQAQAVAPATADLLAKFAHGLADDFLTTTYLAFTGRVVLAPAMNTNMWNHAATRENVKILGNIVHDFDFDQKARPPLLLPLHPPFS